MKSVFSSLMLDRPALLLLAAAFAAAGAEYRASAQQVEEDAEDKPAPAAVNRVELEQARRVAELQQREHMRATCRLDLDRFRFSELDGSADPCARVERLVSLRIAELTRECRLTEAQVQKLELAGKGDVKRFVDRWENVTRILADPAAESSELRRVFLDWKTVAINWKTNLVGDGSLLSKTLQKTLRPEQAALHEIALASRRRQRYEEAIGGAVKSLQSNLSLSDRQSERLARLLVERTRPPKKFGRASDVALVLCQISRLPEDSLRPIFDAGQWRTLEHWLSAYKPGAGVAQSLERHGFVFEDAADPGRPTSPAVTPTGKKTGRPIGRTEDARP